MTYRRHGHAAYTHLCVHLHAHTHARAHTHTHTHSAASLPQGPHRHGHIHTLSYTDLCALSNMVTNNLRLVTGEQTLVYLLPGQLGIRAVALPCVPTAWFWQITPFWGITRVELGRRGLMQFPVSCPGQHWVPREDGAHHQDLSYPRQPLGSVLQPLQGVHRHLHPGTRSFTPWMSRDF